MTTRRRPPASGPRFSRRFLFVGRSKRVQSCASFTPQKRPALNAAVSMTSQEGYQPSQTVDPLLHHSYRFSALGLDLSLPASCTPSRRLDADEFTNAWFDSGPGQASSATRPARHGLEGDLRGTSAQVEQEGSHGR